VSGWREDAAREIARIRVDLAAAAADATPLDEVDLTAGDLTRVRSLLQQLAGAVASLLGTDLAVVWTTDPVERVLVASAWVGFAEDYIAPMRVAYGSGSAGRAVVERRTVLIEDVTSDPGYAPWVGGALQHGVRAVLSVPMLTLSGAPMGALSSYYRTATRPDPRDIELAEVYARQAAEIVERARLHGQARQLAALERRRGEQLRALAQSALALSAADSLEELMTLVTEAAVAIVGCHQGVTTRMPTGWSDATTYVSLSERYAQWRDYDVVPKGLGVLESVVRDNRPLRLSAQELIAHPDWRGLRDAPGHPPMPDYLAAPLVGRDGTNLGLVQLSHKLDDTPFTAEDEAVLVQLAQMASSTIERLEALQRERLARREAEAAAVVHAVLSEASAVFAERFEAEGIASALVDLVVPRIADLAMVHIVDGEGAVRMAAITTAELAELDRARDFYGGFQVDVSQPYGAGAALATGVPQLLPEITAEILQAITPAVVVERIPGLMRRSCICVPLSARGRSVGVLSLLRDEPYSEPDLEYAVDLGRRAALALDNANQYAFERDLAVTLQRSLLPRQLATGPGFTAAARYLPGARGTQVGGDWYDAIEVEDGLVLVIGDVMGRGVQAAAQMGQLQATVRAYALDGHGPAAILTRLDKVVLAVEDLHFTTCVVVHLDPVRRHAVLASAGHLPPLLVCADGTASLLELEPGLPLGVGGATFVEREVELEAGALLLLYTDGLVESRDSPVDTGLARLVTALSAPLGTVEQVCDRVLAALGRDGGHDDDTAVLAVQLGPDTPLLELVLPCVPEAARTARHALRVVLPGEHDVAELLLTEVVANAVRHAGRGEVSVRAHLISGVLRLEVVDASPRLPGAASDPGLDAESGRGLMLVEMLAGRWGAKPLPGGKCVWFELLV